MTSRKLTLITILCSAAALVAGFAAGGAVAPAPMSPESQGLYEVRLSSAGLTSPLLECEDHRREAMPEARYFNADLREKVAEIEAREGVNRVAVYFRDLESGLAIGINQDEKFLPASLAKVPVMIACLKLAELDPEYLEKKLKYTGYPEWMKSYHYPPAKTIEAGREYKVSELLENAIVYSDNASVKLLMSDLPQGVVEEVLYDFGLSANLIETRMSAAEYGRFFRILYNASYLNEEMSEKALRLLSMCRFDAGMVSGLPAGVTVAHKFGEMHRKIEASKPFQLHDCGIVYAAGSPYLLCVMTGGEDYAPLEKAIQDVTRFVHEKASQRISILDSGFPRIANL